MYVLDSWLGLAFHMQRNLTFHSFLTAKTEWQYFTVRKQNIKLNMAHKVPVSYILVLLNSL